MRQLLLLVLLFVAASDVLKHPERGPRKIVQPQYVRPKLRPCIIRNRTLDCGKHGLWEIRDPPPQFRKRVKFSERAVNDRTTCDSFSIGSTNFIQAFAVGEELVMLPCRLTEHKFWRRLHGSRIRGIRSRSSRGKRLGKLERSEKSPETLQRAFVTR